MKIIADENIPYVNEAFGNLGEVEIYPAAEITPDKIKSADVLLVRSVTKVNEKLLGGSESIQYVATATIGYDHIDRDYLAARGIHFASAPGSNATSVSEWVFAAILETLIKQNREIEQLTLGIIGVGNVGSRVLKKAKAVGMKTLCCDPPRQRAEGEAEFCNLRHLLENSDIITIHVPLNREGEDKTAGMVNDAFFEAVKPGAIFMNSSRGGVVDEKSLLEARLNGKVSTILLDVWLNEPKISADTIRATAIATPHIAGYSFDGKVAGTVMIFEGACNALGINASWDPTPLLPEPAVPEVRLKNSGKTFTQVLREAAIAVYPIMTDDQRLRETTNMSEEERSARFTALRKSYPVRREFNFTRISLDRPDEKLAAGLRGLGFKLDG